MKVSARTLWKAERAAWGRAGASDSAPAGFAKISRPAPNLMPSLSRATHRVAGRTEQGNQK